MNNALLLHRAPKLTNFSVLFEYYEPKLKPQIDLWVRFATTAKVDQLSLRLSPSIHILYKRYELPQHLYANEFVSELDFHYCKIKPNGLIGWSSLKRLYFGYTSLPDDVIKKVLLGSPRLESLELHECYDFYRLDMVSESLKKLVIDSYYGEVGWDEELELEIVAPKIESLEIIGKIYNMKFQIKDVLALVEVNLDFEIPEPNQTETDEDWDDICKGYENIVRELFESASRNLLLANGVSWLVFLDYSLYQYFFPVVLFVEYNTLCFS